MFTICGGITVCSNKQWQAKFVNDFYFTIYLQLCKPVLLCSEHVAFNLILKCEILTVGPFCL